VRASRRCRQGITGSINCKVANVLQDPLAEMTALSVAGLDVCEWYHMGKCVLWMLLWLAVVAYVSRSLLTI